MQNSAFSPRSAGFLIFALGAPVLSNFQQSARVCTRQRFQPEVSTFCSFSHRVYHFLKIFTKVHEFVQNSAFSPRSAGFLIFALGAPVLSNFQQSARVCTRQRFQPEVSTFCSFLHRVYHFLAFSAKCTSFCKSEFLSPEHNVLSFSHLAHHFLATCSKVQEFVQNSVFSPTSERFAIFALGAQLFSDFKQSTRFCAKQRFQPEISTSSHFRQWVHYFLVIFSKVDTSLYKTAISAQDQHDLSFSH